MIPVMLKQRILSALVVAPLFIAAVLLIPTAAFKALLAVLVAVCAFEWARLSHVDGAGGRVAYAVVLVLCGYLVQGYADELRLHRWVYWLALVWWAAVCIWLVCFQRAGWGRRRLGRTGALSMGAVTLLPAWFALVSLHGLPGQGPALALYVFLLVWAADIGAYAAGKLFGRSRLASEVSPGKTVEGVLGGLLFVMLLAAGAVFYFGYESSGLIFILLSVFCGALSVAGDLLESIMKRQAGAKDSGSLLPGHGGALDRLDSLMAAAPLFVLGFFGLIAG